MRVYLGGDHAGFELKQAIIEHLTATGHETVDCGAFDYDAEDDYPAFCIAAAVKTVADPASLGIVLAVPLTTAPARGRAASPSPRSRTSAPRRRASRPSRPARGRTRSGRTAGP